MNRNITAALLVISVLFLALLYNRYRFKRQATEAMSESNRKLHKLVNEREWLVREIHHRVKNNLQTIMNLLESQSFYLRDDALEAIKVSQHRVHAMSLIHQKLYLSDHLATINMPRYIGELSNYLFDSFSVNNRKLDLYLDDINLDVSLAIPIGLILNEALTNSLKYGFPGGSNGEIGIALKNDLDGSKINLDVWDKGIGLPDDYLMGKAGSMGLKLIYGLAGEIGARLVVGNQGGTRIHIEFDQSKNTAEMNMGNELEFRKI